MTEQPAEGRWQHVLAFAMGPILEIVTLVVVIAVGIGSYYVVTGRSEGGGILSPPETAALLVANLVPAMTLMVLVARRIARRRAGKLGLGKGRLHARLVVLFSIIAAIPTLLVVVFASVLFQSSQEFWFSDRWRGSVETAVDLTQRAYQQEADRVQRETVTMAADLSAELQSVEYDNPEFANFFGLQVRDRNLSEAILFMYTPQRGIQTLVLVNPYERDFERAVDPRLLSGLHQPFDSAPVNEANRVGIVTRFPSGENLFLYSARVYGENTAMVPQNEQQAASLRFESVMIDQLRRGDTLRTEYEALSVEARNLQFRFSAALLLVSLLIVGLAIVVAFIIADRVVRPVGQLVDAARKVSGGDLSARVPDARVRDEIGTLGEAFNAMTGQLEEQTGALMSANEQLGVRGAFMEAVLAGVTAGVISVDEQRRVGLVNRTAESLLETSGLSPVGRALSEVAPELDKLLTEEQREAVVQFATRGEPRTLAVKIVAVEGGHVMTFDDITEQLIDQRRAAWSDVARRIAHEIKNPLTPIQLAAERLQRRYGQEVTSDPAVFERLTGTIVRQVGDLRRMVDEFSSFARMPKPVFHEEAIADIARQALFLHEVAHPDIRFSMDVADEMPTLVCDRRLIGQALTNIVKNGVEAIEQKRDETGGTGADAVTLAILANGPRLTITVTDTGIGLPQDRRRLTEPYMTTRAKGTGLGLAIVKKIVEEHFGTIEFDDAPKGPDGVGGTCVTLSFDMDLLGRIAAGHVRTPEDTEVNG